MTKAEIEKQERIHQQRMANLTMFDQMSEEERKAIASKGGIKSGEARRHNKTFKEAMQWALELPAIKGNPTVDKIAKRYPGLTNRDAMTIAMVAEAIQKQDVKAYIAARDTTGELPEQTVNVKNDAPMVIKVETVD